MTDPASTSLITTSKWPFIEETVRFKIKIKMKTKMKIKMKIKKPS